jgi:phosphate transport system substrate-binding protein
MIVAIAGTVLAIIAIGTHIGYDRSADKTKTPIPTISLRVAGSTTVQPVSEILARMYMKNKPNVRILVEGGGSGNGIRQVGEGATEIGATSRPLDPAELARFPNLRVNRIGGSAVVIIANRDFPGDVVAVDEMRALYDNQSTDLSRTTGVNAVRAVVQRSDPSGTEETFAQWLFGSSIPSVNGALEARDRGVAGDVLVLAGPSNAAVLDLVKQSENAIGFVDIGYAVGDPGVKILRVLDTGENEALPRNTSEIHESILYELSHPDGRNSAYIERLTRPLAYVTNGDPSPPAAAFIAFAQSDEATFAFTEVGYYSIAEIRGAA